MEKNRQALGCAGILLQYCQLPDRYSRDIWGHTWNFSRYSNIFIDLFHDFWRNLRNVVLQDPSLEKLVYKGVYLISFKNPVLTRAKGNVQVIHNSNTGCPRRNVRDFGRVFLMLNYTDITQNTYVQS
jgi:hypothetical protein